MEDTVLVPLTITVFNLFPPTDFAPTKRIFRPEHTSRLLVDARLDIYRREQVNNSDGFVSTADVVVLSARLDQPSIHPSWYHLEDRIKAEHLELDLHLRIVVLSENKETVVINDMPLNPKLLRRLPEHQENYKTSWGQPRPPPKELPINAVVIQYSDGSTRVNPSLYHLLLHRNIIEEEDPADSSLLEDDEEEKRRTRRFNDNTFTVLDQSVESLIQPEPSSLLETNEEFLATAITKENLIDEAETDNETNPSSTKLDVDVADLQKEKDALVAMLLQEEQWLESDAKLLNEKKFGLREIVDEIKTIERETNDIWEYVSMVREDQQRLEPVIEGQRIKLLKELRTIYPIQCKPEQHYFIRGIELPLDLHVGLVTEDEISAALGYVCHSLVMMSKYLSIPLPYRIVCNSSRSAVQEDGATILPLFQSRVVERDFLDRGMLLLDRNVETLAKYRNIKCGEKSHILAKMKRIYDKIVDER